VDGQTENKTVREIMDVKEKTDVTDLGNNLGNGSTA
jgi:hypothetical protein